MKNVVISVLFALLLMAIIFYGVVSCETMKVDAVCKSHGFTSGRAQIDANKCVQEIICVMDDVIVGTCKPIDKGE